METMTEITQAEVARRQRAQRFESLTGTRDSLEGRIAGLEAELLDVTPLEKIAKLASTVSTGIYTRSGRGVLGLGISNGMCVRDVLITIVAGTVVDKEKGTREGGAIEDARMRNEKRERQLTDLRAQLKQVETELKEFA